MLIQAFAEAAGAGLATGQRGKGSRCARYLYRSQRAHDTIHAGDPYEKQAKETAQLVGRQITGLTPEFAALRFSEPGYDRRPVAGPTVESAMLEMKKARPQRRGDCSGRLCLRSR